MQRAFVVVLDLDDGTDVDAVTAELTADLSDFDVISIHPWASPTATPTGVLPSTTQPTVT